MSLIAQIKGAQLDARKSRRIADASLLTTLIGEAEMVGKNAGHEVTDAEVVQVIKKFMKNIEDTIVALGAQLEKVGVGSAAGDPFAEKIVYARDERIVLEGFLPKQMSPDEIRVAVEGIVSGLQATGVDNPTMGDVMKYMKTRFEGLYDGKVASTIIKEYV